MAETLLTIHEAAAITGKSVQTIRRAVKAKKLEARKRKTPQGYSYLVTQASVASYYGKREQGSIKEGKTKEKGVSNDSYATLNDLKSMEREVAGLLHEYKNEKESFMRFMKAFQERFVVLENQLKLLEEPKKKSWFAFWK